LHAEANSLQKFNSFFFVNSEKELICIRVFGFSFLHNYGMVKGRFRSFSYLGISPKFSIDFLFLDSPLKIPLLEILEIDKLVLGLNMRSPPLEGANSKIILMIWKEFWGRKSS